MVNVASIIDDLIAEQADLGAAIAGLSRQEWDCPTPAPGWTVAHQIAHLAFFDRVARIALTAPEEFAAIRARADEDADQFSSGSLAPYLALRRDELAQAWRSGTEQLGAELRAAPPSVRIPWFGPSMSVASHISARLMETWAHGQDVLDTFGIHRPATPRLRHVAVLALHARPYSYAVNHRTVPARPVRLRLDGPDGPWHIGDSDATDVIRGSALDFCLVATRRRHFTDTQLTAHGDAARDWLEILQAYAGEPGPGRTPGQFSQSRLSR